MQPILWWTGIVALTSLSGCVYHVFSPPARVAPLESPQVLPRAVNSVSAEAFTSGAVLGPNLVGGAVRYRRGLVEGMEGSAEITLLHVEDIPSNVHTWPDAYAVRTGVKFQPISPLALTFGIGGGGSAAGGFISPDLGLILGYENPYVVPFINGRVFMSQPIGARRIYLGENMGAQFGTPQTTWGVDAGLGLRIPLQHDVPAAHSILLGLGLTDLFDGHEHEAFFDLTGGLDIVFD